MKLSYIAQKSALVLWVASLLFSTAHAEALVTVNHNDREWILPVPEGFCDISQEVHGMGYIKFVNDFLATQPYSISAVAAYQDCNEPASKLGRGLWGYIAIQDLDAGMQLDQETYNKLTIKALSDTSFMNKVMDKVGKDVMQEFDGIIKEMRTDMAPKIVHADENSLMNFSYQTVAALGREVLLFGVNNSTAMGDAIVHGYIYKGMKDMNEVPPNYIPLMAAHAKRIKELNRQQVSY